MTNEVRLVFLVTVPVVDTKVPLLRPSLRPVSSGSLFLYYEENRCDSESVLGYPGLFGSGGRDHVSPWSVPVVETKLETSSLLRYRRFMEGPPGTSDDTGAFV